MSTIKCRVGVEWLDTFKSPCKENNGLNNLSYTDDQTNGFFNAMTSRGHTGVFRWTNDDAWETDWRDPSFGGSGDSHSWTDNVNFVFFSAHGGNDKNIFSIYFSKQQLQCSSGANTWRLGSKMLKWVAFATCDTVLNTSSAHVGAVWFGPCQGIHLVLGFVGTSADSWWTRGLGGDYAGDVNGGATIAGAWLDDGYSFWTGDTPIAIACGTSVDDAVNRRDHENLNWRDINVTFTGALAWKWKD
jgi:hypothetical protein